jgi:hypothetical protein
MNITAIAKYYFWSPGTPYIVALFFVAWWAWTCRVRSSVSANRVLTAVAIEFIARSVFLIYVFNPGVFRTETFYIILNLSVSILHVVALLLFANGALGRGFDPYSSPPGSRPPETWGGFMS